MKLRGSFLVVVSIMKPSHLEPRRQVYSGGRLGQEGLKLHKLLFYQGPIKMISSEKWLVLYTLPLKSFGSTPQKRVIF